VKARRAGRIVSAAVIATVGGDSDGQRKVLGMDIGSFQAEPFGAAFLRKLARGGLRASSSSSPTAMPPICIHH